MTVAGLLDLDSDGALTAVDAAGWWLGLSAVGLVILLAGTAIFALFVLALKTTVFVVHASVHGLRRAATAAADIVVDALHRAMMTGGPRPRPRPHH